MQNNMHNLPIILGSTSPRRKELMTMLGYDFTVVPSDFDETLSNWASPEDYVKQIALKKGENLLVNHQDKLIVCADTIVVVNGEILGKPRDKDDARKMLLKLSNTMHEVYTALFVCVGDKKELAVESSKVYVDKLTYVQIEEYLNTTEPYDKAGAYAIQGCFAKYITKIEGDYYNIVGLPLNKTYKLVESFINNNLKK